MILLSYVWRLAVQPGVYWLFPDPEVVVGALRTYKEEGHYIADLNVRVVAATQDPLEVDLTWLLRRPFSYLPPVICGDQCQLSPTALSHLLHEQASISAHVGYEARSGATYTPGSGLPLEWFNRDQHRHIWAHRKDKIPTIIVLAHWSSDRNTVLDMMCLPCRAQQETAPRVWDHSAKSHEWRPARQRPLACLEKKLGSRAVSVCNHLWEPALLEQWAAVWRTPSMQRAHMECSPPHILRTEFLRHVIEGSIGVWYAQAKARATLLKARAGPSSTVVW